MPTTLNRERPSAPAPPSCAPPIIALGGGVTLAGVLNILHRSGLQTYALCADSDFVTRSRWYQALPGTYHNPRPCHLRSILETLDLPEAVLLPCSDDWLRAVASLPPELSDRSRSSTPGKLVETLVDKWRFAQLLERLDVPRPRTYLLSSPEQIGDLAEFEGAILRPLSSVDFAARYGVKGYIVGSRQEALERVGQIELPIMIQEFIPGPANAGYFLDGFRDHTG